MSVSYLSSRLLAPFKDRGPLFGSLETGRLTHPLKALLALLLVALLVLTLGILGNSETARKEHAAKAFSALGTHVLPITDYFSTYDLDFGASFFFISDRNFFKEIEVPFKLKILKDEIAPAWRTQSTKLGGLLYPVFFFINPSISERGKTHITADLTILAPSGEEFITWKNLDISPTDITINREKFYIASKSKRLQMSGVLKRSGTPLEAGEYKVKAIIRDNISGREIPIEQNFEVAAR